MVMRELFKEQLQNNKPITEESPECLKKVKYHSGEYVQPGDIVLTAMLQGKPIKRIPNITETSLELIILCEKDFGLYEPIPDHNSTSIPYIKLKRKK